MNVTFPDTETCEAHLAAMEAGPFSTFDTPAAVEASIASGDIAYDETKMETCLTAIAARDCDSLGGNPILTITACREALSGQVAKDGACVTHAACASGHFCSVAVQEKPCEGTCQPIGEGVCVNDGHCLEGQRCVYGPTGGACETPAAADGACESDQGCQPGLYCRHGDNGGTCRPLPGPNEPCDGQCAPGSNCEPDRETNVAVCVAMPVDGEPCRDFSCAEGHRCDFAESETATCVALLGEGEPCEVWECAHGLTCTGEPATCQGRAKKGESCANSAHCGTPHSLTWCNPDTDVCEPLPKGGEPCATFMQTGWPVNVCNPLEAWCNEALEEPACIAIKPAGASCESDVECGGEALGAGCVDGQCHRPQPEACEP